MVPGTVIGVDFDNTIVSYDAVIAAVARRRGLVDASVPGDKRSLRDAIRRTAEGDVAWQRVQADIYGPAIGEAELIPGVAAFFARCRALGLLVHVVSHKTRFASYDTTGTDLRVAALGWLETQGAFRTDGFGLTPERVWFSDTRSAKLERIAALGCAAFIDDLVEVLREPDFPQGVERILFDPAGSGVIEPDVTVLRSWSAITEHLFADAETAG